ncbi:MAG: twin-arginine translocation signal domain-containing protein [Thermoguttaceae bacterium]|nr:twin-arginine translocation signal domain-containing protein [Thermoguttaceae bacterium]
MERREFLTKSALTAAALPLAISSVGSAEGAENANPSGYKTHERYRPATGFDWKPGPSNEPVGEAKGIFPGRVATARYPEAARRPGKRRKKSPTAVRRIRRPR